MKHIFTWIILAALTTATACKPQEIASSTGGGIALAQGRMTINGKLMTGSAWSLAMLQEVLGKADREFKGANDIYTYDDKGILLYETTGAGTVNEVQVYLATPSESYEFSPSGVWTSHVSIEGQAITSGMSKDVLLKKLPKYGFKLSYAANVFRGTLMGTYVFATFSPDLKQLQYLSFGVE